MSLPKIMTPRIPVTLPTTGDKLVLRQMLVKEYKSIMSAINTQDTAIFLRTLSEVINDCIVEPKDFDVSNRASFEVEYLFLQIYAASINGTIEVSMRCTNPVEKPELEKNKMGFVVETGKTITAPCDTVFDLKIPVSEIVLSEVPNLVYDIGFGIILKLKYPTWKTMQELVADFDESEEDEYDDEDLDYDNLPAKEVKRLEAERKLKEDERSEQQTLKALYSCIDEIWVNDEKHDEEFTFEEFSQWIAQFPIDKLQQITDFIQKQPQVTYTNEVVCPNCENKHVITLVGLNDFLK